MPYGHIPRPTNYSSADLKPRLYPLAARAQSSDRGALLFVPFIASGDSQKEYESNVGVNGLVPPNALMEYLGNVFNVELEKGITYPQRGPMDDAEFRDYFLGDDLTMESQVHCRLWVARSLALTLPVEWQDAITSNPTIPVDHRISAMAASSYHPPAVASVSETFSVGRFFIMLPQLATKEACLT